jgi:hypothetical protein
MSRRRGIGTNTGVALILVFGLIASAGWVEVTSPNLLRLPGGMGPGEVTISGTASQSYVGASTTGVTFCLGFYDGGTINSGQRFYKASVTSGEYSISVPYSAVTPYQMSVDETNLLGYGINCWAGQVQATQSQSGVDLSCGP